MGHVILFSLVKDQPLLRPLRMSFFRWRNWDDQTLMQRGGKRTQARRTDLSLAVLPPNPFEQGYAQTL